MRATKIQTNLEKTQKGEKHKQTTVVERINK
jgi:hypothetical protein